MAIEEVVNVCVFISDFLCKTPVFDVKTQDLLLLVEVNLYLRKLGFIVCFVICHCAKYLEC